jgi:hypothetical protein
MGIKPSFVDLELFQWLLPYCHNLRTLTSNVPMRLSGIGVNEFLQLKNLRNLSIAIQTPIQLEEVRVQLFIKDRN